MSERGGRGHRGGGGRGGQPSSSPGRGGGGRGHQPSPAPYTGRGGVGRGHQPFHSAGVGGGHALGTGAPPPASYPFPQPVPALDVLSQEVVQKLSLEASSSSSIAGARTPDVVPAVNPAPERPQLPPASSKAVRCPPRPSYGRLGKKIVVKANHFLVSVADRDLNHYDVSISPEVTSKKVCRDVMKQLVQSFKASHLGNRMLAYDGRKSVYTAGPLPFTSKDFVVKLDNDGSRRDREFKVSIKFASKADLHHLHQFLSGKQHDAPQETIQFLDVVLREKPSNCYEVVGRSFFSPRLGRKGELGNGLEYWKGFYQSLRPTQMGLSLNIDMSARAFFEPILVTEYIQKHLCKDVTRPLSDQDRVKLKRTLRGIRVELNHSKNVKRYKISGLSNEPAHQLMFTLKTTGENISVAEYYRQTYDIVLEYPFLPVILAGSDTKPTYLPMELCTIIDGQRYSKKLNERQVTELLRATCQRPHEREDSIMKMVVSNDYNNDVLASKEFGICLKPELTAIEARVLPPPMLQYHKSGRESRIEPFVGQWNMINKKMVNGGKVDFWTCVCFSRNIDSNRFCHELIGMCIEKGMEFNGRPLIQPRTAQSNQIEKALHDIAAESSRQGRRLQLLIVILPDLTGSYDKIKRVCETELGIVTQCCQPKKASKFSKQYMENVALKINVKVGGRNSVLEIAKINGHPFLCDRPTIVFGADVTHPSPGEDSSPSIAAVVASMDWPEVTKYRALVSAQGHRDEIVKDLYKINEDPTKGRTHSGMIREHLIAFYKSTNRKAERIIFYRDGVSEGQFSHVLLHEVDAIRRACKSIQEDYLPRITFVVVQKRHHTRLFPANHNDRKTTDKSGNILPGTVVDTKICHPTEFDFYLCSHAGIQGTSRPAHYHVLYDENGFTADAMQMLTNNLCYTYARCTRSVSIVPPAYYAHLAAARARCYIADGMYLSDSGSATGGAPGGATTRERNANVRPLPAIAENVKEVMFYC